MKKSPLSGKNLTQLIVLVLFFASNIHFASAQQKVVGGIDVDIKDYPWQVAVDYGCGGSIIGDSWVLTAAHCVGGGVNYIYAGNSAPYASGGETYSVVNVITHPLYGSGTSYSHDFALVEIEGEFNFSNPNIGKIDLISTADVLAGSEDAGVMATITGWGTLESGGAMAPTLQMVQAPIVANDVACGSATDENGNSGDYGCSSLDGSMICAGDLIDGGEDACQGDSGGPLVVRSLIDNRWLLIGATSWGYGCADVNYPGVWARVSYVLDWIEDNADVNSEYGCMDVAACNYSDEAIYNVPEACVYEIDECGDCGGDGPAPGYDCDGNCVTGETLVVEMLDSYGDGWNGSNLVVNGVSVTLSSGSSGSEVLCFDSTAGCNEVSVSEGSWPSEVSWTISDGNGNVLLSGGAPYAGGFGAENCGPVMGCTDASALNYNEEATADDGSCLYPVSGCMDTLALNFNPAAVEDDGSCEYPIDCSGLTSVLVEVTDGSWPSEVSWELGDFSGGVGTTSACIEDGCISFKMLDSYGDGWNGSTVTVSSADGQVLLTGTLDSGSEGTLYFGLNYEGDCGPIYGCMDVDALNFNPEATQDDGSCAYPIPGCTDVEALNYNADAEVEDGSCYYDYDVLGCTDATADNYNADATYDDGSCEYPFSCDDGYVADCNGNCSPLSWVGDGICDDGGYTSGGNSIYLNCEQFDNDGGDCGDVVPDGFGCTDSTALNFDPEAIEDDGSCQYPIDCDGLTFVTIDVGGGSWQEEVSWTIGGFSGGVGLTDACLEDGCLTFTMLDSYGDGWNGNSVTITSETGDVLLTGTLDTGSEGTLSFGLNFDGDCGPVYGCTDTNALNYNEEATEDDGSCEYPIAGCTDDTALNYNPDAVEDDGSCEYPVDCSGLTNVSITVTDGGYPSEVSWSIGDLNGGTGTTIACLEDGCLTFNMIDSYGDGWNGSEVTITTETGDVLLTGTLDAGYEGVLFFALNDECGDGPVYGCTDPEAINYNENANTDDGSCDYDVIIDYGACTDPNAINYDPNATFDDGSCEYENTCNGLAATLTLNTVDYGSEMSWSVVSSAGEVVGSGDGYSNDASYQSSLCLDEGVSYSFEANDSYGDGWHGAYFMIETNECILATGGSDFTDGSFAEYAFTASCGDTDPCAAVDCAEGYECVDGDCILIDAAPWDVYITGTNHTIVIDGSAVIDLGETTIEAGDVLGVFFTNDNGDLQCAGQTTWTGSNGAIAAQGDDSTTDELDGFVSGSEFIWMVWDASEGVEMMVLATYNQALNDQGNFVVNGYSALAGLTSMPAGPSEQLLSIPSGWSNFSTYMSPENMDMGAFLSPIISDVIIAKDNVGLAFLPEWNFNGIGDLQVGQGYQVKLSNANELQVVGEYMTPDDNPINLTAGWNMIGYLRTDAAAADAVLVDITSTGNLVIAKDYSGNAYLPEWNFNGIGDMVPGEAYQLKTNNADVLQYLSNDDSYRMSAIEVTENNVSHFAKAQVTDNNMTVVIEDAAWDVLPTEGAELAAFDKDGNMVGSAIYSSPVTVLTVWGDDVTSTSKDGMLVSESVSFKVWNTNEVRDFTVSKWIEGSSSYQVDGISVASTIETNNVMTELNASERVLVKVINVLGQEVNMDDEPFKGTILFNVYDDGSVERFLE